MMSHTHNTGKLLPSGLLSRAAANFILCVEGWHFYAPPSVETERRVVESYDGNLLWSEWRSCEARCLLLPIDTNQVLFHSHHQAAWQDHRKQGLSGRGSGTVCYIILTVIQWERESERERPCPILLCSYLLPCCSPLLVPWSQRENGLAQSCFPESIMLPGWSQQGVYWRCGPWVLPLLKSQLKSEIEQPCSTVPWPAFKSVFTSVFGPAWGLRGTCWVLNDWRRCGCSQWPVLLSLPLKPRQLIMYSATVTCAHSNT